MLTSLASAVQSAASTLAPEIPPVVDLRHHWNEFLKYYSSTGKRGNDSERASRPVEMTHQVHHLNSMLKLLAQEQRDKKAAVVFVAQAAMNKFQVQIQFRFKLLIFTAFFFLQTQLEESNIFL